MVGSVAGKKNGVERCSRTEGYDVDRTYVSMAVM
jgi:hypothetical protein